MSGLTPDTRIGTGHVSGLNFGLSHTLRGGYKFCRAFIVKQRLKLECPNK